MPSGPSNSFNQDLLIETAISKRKRTYIFIGALIISLAYSILNLFISDYGLLYFFDNPASYSIILVWHLAFIIYEMITLVFINKFIKRGSGIPRWFIMFNVFIEITFPSLLFASLIFFEKKEILLDSQYMLIYFLIIILSALHLDFKISLGIGIVTALQYAIILLLTLNSANNVAEYNIVLPSSVYYTKIVILLLAGTCAGFAGDEIKKRVMTSMNYLQERNEIEMLFNQQVSKEVVNTLLKEKNASKRAEVTIMFLDIRNFSSFAETKDPEEVISFQNNIFRPFIEIINQNDGVVNQILGDGIMATFGAPIKNLNHTSNAFFSGNEILKRLQIIIKSGIIPPTKVGIGLHTGQVITGNIGSEHRKQYSISGSPVIIAARIEQLNKKFNSQFLITKEVYDKVNQNGDIFEYIGKEHLKGIEQTKEIYKVVQHDLSQEFDQTTIN